MWYTLFRLILGVGLFIGISIFLKRTNIIHKRLIKIFGIIIILILIDLSVLFPVENLFIRFSSPESALSYSVINGGIQGKIDGNQSTLILYQSGDSTAISIFPKDEKGWKIGTHLSYEQILSKNIDKYHSIDIYHTKNTDDYYILVFNPFSSGISEVANNKKSVFKTVIEEIPETGKKNIIYYSYVPSMDNNYSLFINGKIVV